MSMRKIIYVLPSGDVVETVIVGQRREGETQEECETRIAQADAVNIPSVIGAPRVAVDADSLPVGVPVDDLSIVSNGLAVDPSRVKKRVLREVRRERDRLLKDSDTSAVRAIETGKQDKDLSDYRQSLRDLPAVLSAELDSLDNEKLQKFKPIFPVLASGDNIAQDKIKRVVKS